MDTFQEQIDNFICNSEYELSDKEFTDPKMYAAIYARTSTKEDSLSIQTQIDSCKDVLFKNNLILYKIYSEKESASSQDFTKRKEFSKLIADAENGMFKTVIVLRRDRLSRKTQDHIKIRRILKKHDVNVIYVKEGDLDTSGDNHFTRFIDNMMIAISSLEATTIASRTLPGIYSTREKGLYSSRRAVPYGFCISGEFKLPHSNDTTISKSYNKYEYDKKNSYKSDFIKEIFKHYSQLTEDEISNYKSSFLNLKNKLITIDLTKKSITLSGIFEILENSIYGGYMIRNKTINKKTQTIFDMIVEDDSGKYVLDKDKLIKAINVTPFIDESIWETSILNAYKIMIRNRSPDDANSAKSYLFKNMILCSKCKKIFTLKENEYICKKSCSSINVNYFIRSIFHSLILENVLKSHIEFRIKQEENEIKSNNINLKYNDKKLRDALSQYVESPNQITYKTILKYREIDNQYKNLLAYNYMIKSILKSCESDLDGFINRTTEFSNEDIEYLKENYQIFNSLINSFTNKITYNEGGEINLHCEKRL